MDELDNQSNEFMLMKQHIEILQQRVSCMEQLLQRHFGYQQPIFGEGQHQIPSDPRRTESGMGPLLNTNSKFV